MLSELPDSAFGEVSNWLLQKAESRAQELIETLLDQAISQWSSTGFSRFNADEECCTVRIYSFARDRKAQSAEYALVSIVLESTTPTRGMLDGTEHPRSAVRPDLRFEIGSISVPVEAKRLGKKAPLPKNYVVKGMARFETGYYSVSPSHPGLMLAYLDGESASDAKGYVDPHIASELPGHTGLTFCLHKHDYDLYTSENASGLKLIHRLIGM